MIIPDSIFDNNITVINIKYIVNQVNEVKKELDKSQIDKEKIPIEIYDQIPECAVNVLKKPTIGDKV